MESAWDQPQQRHQGDERMALTVNTNIEAMDAARNLNTTETQLSNAMQRLSSGLRINSPADDVAGYAISQRLKAQVNGLNQATMNSQDAVALSQTAEGALNGAEEILQRVRSLSVEFANGTTSEGDKESIENEVEQLKEEITRIAETTKFNGVELLAGGEEITFQVGANEKETISVKTVELEKDVEGVKVEEIKTVEEAIEKVATAAGEYGAVQESIQYTSSNLEVYAQNLSSATSGFVDVNMATEMTAFTKDEVLQQAGVAILAQANQLPDAVLHLIE
jgi:flagellin